MGRPATHTVDDFLDAAVTLFAEQGSRAVTMSAVARHVGAPSGSIYHRFPDRPALLAAVWLRTVRRFQSGFLAALQGEDSPMEAAVGAATHTIAWCRKNPQQATILYAGRHAFSPDEWSPADVQQSDSIDATLTSAVRSLSRKLKPVNSDEIMLALVDLPYAVARRHLANGQTPPPRAVDLVGRTARALLTKST
jgi:AcrR family transcriptional regulator